MSTVMSENLFASRGQSAIGDLRTRLRGRVLQSEDPEYDMARAIWNGMIDRRPALIARCVESGDVIQALL